MGKTVLNFARLTRRALHLAGAGLEAGLPGGAPPEIDRLLPGVREVVVLLRVRNGAEITATKSLVLVR